MSVFGHNLNISQFKGISLCFPQLREFIDEQVVEMERVLKAAASGVLYYKDGQLMWRHVDQDDSVVKVGDRFEVTPYGLQSIRD